MARSTRIAREGKIRIERRCARQRKAGARTSTRIEPILYMFLVRHEPQCGSPFTGKQMRRRADQPPQGIKDRAVGRIGGVVKSKHVVAHTRHIDGFDPLNEMWPVTVDVTHSCSPGLFVRREQSLIGRRHVHCHVSCDGFHLGNLLHEYVCVHVRGGENELCYFQIHLAQERLL